MYIVNPEKLDVTKLYKCNTFIRDWLIYYQHLSLFGMSQDGHYYFARSDKLTKALSEMPWYLKIVDNLNK